MEMCANGLLHNGLIVVVHDDGVHIVLVHCRTSIPTNPFSFPQHLPHTVGSSQGGYHCSFMNG